MAVAEGISATTPVRLRSFAELVQDSPQPLPEVLVPFRAPKSVDGERPSLDSIRSFIRARWGLTKQPIVSSMLRPHNVFIRLSTEEDFVKALTREATNINGVIYRVFKWTTEFHEDKEPVFVPVWISLPGLPPNYYHDSFLRCITAPLGRYLKRDNPTKCATRTEAARVCIEMDVSKEPLRTFWIGIPRQPNSFMQQVIYETLPAYCTMCNMQGHNEKTCKRNGRKKERDHDHKENGGMMDSTRMSKDQENIQKEEKKDIEQGMVIFEEGETSDPLKMQEGETNNQVNNQQTESTLVQDGVEELVPVYPPKEVGAQKEDLLQEDSPDIQNMPTVMEVINEVHANALIAETYTGGEDKDCMIVAGVVEEPGLTVMEDQFGNSVEMNEPNIVKENLTDREEGEFQVCSESEMEGHAEHLAKGKDSISDSEVQVWRDRYNYDSCVSNEDMGGKIWLLWKNETNVVVQAMGDQSITITMVENSKTILMTIVYAKCYYQERRRLWRDLEVTNLQNVPWIVVGDFNIIRNDSERRGGRPRISATIEDFNNAIDICGLMEMKFSGSMLSWCNGHANLTRSWARLDRGFLNASGCDEYPDAHLTYLTRTSSDHAPMLFTLSRKVVPYGYPSFKFQQMWTTHDSFFEYVSKVWSTEGSGSAMSTLAFKLKTLKAALRIWNKQVFGRTASHIEELEGRIKNIETNLQGYYSQEEEMDLMASQLELKVWLDREEQRLSQQAKQTWLPKGEASPVFFRAVSRRNNYQVTKMQLADGNFLTSPKQIHNGAVDYFKNFLEARIMGDMPNLEGLVDKVVTESDNEELCRVPSQQEIKEAVFSIPVDSSPGPDGYGSGFYQACWQIISKEVVEAVEEFFSGGMLPRFYSASFLVLIPKIPNPTSFDKFRPISLCSVFYKVCSKILVTRLSSILSRIISPEQGAFIKGRSIFENISLTQEMFHGLNKPARGGNVVLKIDMAKAYDSIDWRFLLHVLNSFGFSDEVCGIIKQCITTPWYSVVMNGIPKGFFKGGRGLRQGDPLSPYLFILVEEILSRMIKQQIQLGKIKPFYHPRGAPIVSHLLYADDIVIFTNGGKTSLKAVSMVIKKYGEWSGQIVNERKSSIFFSKYMSLTQRRRILRTTGFSEGTTPFNYLGIPIVAGRLLMAHFEGIINRVRDHIEGWKTRLLSSGARLILLKQVLQSIPIHCLSILHTPKGVIKKLERLFSTFFWGVRDGRSKKKWKAWEDLCRPVSEGGVGLRKLQEVHTSLHMKLVWNLLHGTSMWSKFFLAKYVRQKHISIVDPLKGSKFWKTLLQNLPEVQKYSKWQVRDGQLSFWHDKWLSDGPLSNAHAVRELPGLSLTDCKTENGWKVEVFDQLVGAETIEKIIAELGRVKQGNDVLIWLPKAHGNFSTKSAWECIRLRSPILPWAKWLWNPALPKKMSIIMWKAQHNCLPVDDRVCRIGIPLASKCDCCREGNYEDQNHVLATGEFAEQIWRMCALKLELPCLQGKTWREKVESWYRRAKTSSQSGQLIGMLPSIITWRLWNRRCTARMENRQESIQTIWQSIVYWVASVGENLKASPKWSSRDENILRSFRIPYKPKPIMTKTIKWMRPQKGWYKLNVDGSSMGNPGTSGAGGVIRDFGGNFVSGFTLSTGNRTNNFAEFMGLLQGIRCVRFLGLDKIEIEMDSKLVIDWFLKKRCGLWYLEDYWEELLCLLQGITFRITHVYRESNSLADGFARLGATGVNKTWNKSSDLPMHLRGICRLDKGGCPYLRLRTFCG
ncbi:uncharacterized protein LOC122310314 [Carya illinoinensis]|uniref:uncharacterized protein LOC122310314 n=1 Tax=Carya illinoinensis TaxID=32201 RepID=UPI001C72878F|nr:uncharacterized protein LOC122310314 [Carya illinoinensis]